MTPAEELLWYVDEALEGMVEIVLELGDERANRRLEVAGANSPYVVLSHCLGVLEYWGGWLVAGRAYERDRAAEFRATGEVAELVDRVRVAQRQLRTDCAAADLTAPPRGEPDGDDALLPMGQTQGGALAHVVEELAQHRGQMEVTRDVLLTGPP